MSESTAQRVRVGPLAVSVDTKKPLIGAKISKVRDGRRNPRSARMTDLHLPNPSRQTTTPRTPPRDRLTASIVVFEVTLSTASGIARSELF
jgi:hypothetical protein